MTVNTRIRRQGGAAVVTIRAAVLKMMQLGIGDQLALEIANGALVARPVKNARKRYKLSELLQGSDAMSSLNAEVAWAMKGDPVGHEIT